mgnify:FL=1
MSLVSEPGINLETLSQQIGTFEMFVIPKIIIELQTMTSSKSVQRARRARTALEFARQLKVDGPEGNLSTDDAILRYAIDQKTPVATFDQDLRRSLRRAKIPVVTRRSRILILEGAIPPKR